MKYFSQTCLVVWAVLLGAACADPTDNVPMASTSSAQQEGRQTQQADGFDLEETYSTNHGGSPIEGSGRGLKGSEGLAGKGYGKGYGKGGFASPAGQVVTKYTKVYSTDNEVIPVHTKYTKRSKSGKGYGKGGEGSASQESPEEEASASSTYSKGGSKGLKASGSNSKGKGSKSNKGSKKSRTGSVKSEKKSSEEEEESIECPEVEEGVGEFTGEFTSYFNSVYSLLFDSRVGIEDAVEALVIAYNNVAERYAVDIRMEEAVLFDISEGRRLTLEEAISIRSLQLDSNETETVSTDFNIQVTGSCTLCGQSFTFFDAIDSLRRLDEESECLLPGVPSNEKVRAEYNIIIEQLLIPNVQECEQLVEIEKVRCAESA